MPKLAKQQQQPLGHDKMPKSQMDQGWLGMQLESEREAERDTMRKTERESDTHKCRLASP